MDLALAEDSPAEAVPVDTIEFVFGGERRPAIPVGDGLWQLDLSDFGLPPTSVYAVATLIDGREVESDRLVISVLG